MTDTLTQLRLQLLANRFAPLPNIDKKPGPRGWQKLDVTEAAIRDWASRPGWAATGLRVEGGLCVIDADTTDPRLMKAFRKELKRIAPDVAKDALVRTGAPVKLALFCRRAPDDVFSRRHSFTWSKDGSDEGGQILEMFGGERTRQFGILGPHSHEPPHTPPPNGRVLHEYGWVGRSPQDVPFDKLPILTREQSFALLAAFDACAVKLGYQRVLSSRSGQSEPERRFDLTADMRFDDNDGNDGVTLEELGLNLHIARRAGRDYRCSSSFLPGDPGRNRTKCQVGWSGRYDCVTVQNYETDVTHFPIDAQPRAAGAPLFGRAPHAPRGEEDEDPIEEEPPPALPPPPPHGTTEEVKQEAFRAAARWLHGGWGFVAEGEKGGSAVPLRTRRVAYTSLNTLRHRLLAYRLEVIGPRGGITRVSPVDAWLASPHRVDVGGFRMRPDGTWPVLMDEGDLPFVNLYRRPELPEHGDPSDGLRLLDALFPDPDELGWYTQWLGHKLLHPEIPGVGVVMVARGLHGTGRGTLFGLLHGMFGTEYVAEPRFSQLVGQGSQGQYNAFMEHSVLALVGETASNDDNLRQRRSEAYEQIKELVDPERRVRQIVEKGIPHYHALCGPSFIFASNKGSPLMIAEGDRRLTFLRNPDEVPPPEFFACIKAWGKVPENLGAFRRRLERTSLAGFSPYHPLRTSLKDAVIDEGRTALDRAIETALELLPGRIYCREQVREVIAVLQPRQGWPLHNDWAALVERLVPERSERIGMRNGEHNRPQISRGRVAGAFARTRREAIVWTGKNAREVRAELERNELAIRELKQGRKPNPFRVADEPGGA